AAQGSVVGIPLSLSGLNGRGVESYQFEIKYDPTMIEPAAIAADLSGTMCEGLAVAANSPEPGLLKVVVFGTAPVTGDGVFVNLRFNAIGAAGTATRLTISGFRLNDGTAGIKTINSLVIVTP